jgi:putative FmdB family regulatory protein
MLYEYICPDCNKRFERILPVDRRDEAICPACGKPAKRQLPTGTWHVWVGPPEWASAWKAGKVF